MMILDYIKNQIKYITNDKEIKAIIKVGSQIYTNNNNDSDFLVIVKNYLMPNRKHIEYEDRTLDLIILDEETYFNKINLINTKTEHMIHNYQLTDYFVNKNILDKKEDFELLTFDISNKDIMKTYSDIVRTYHDETAGKFPAEHIYALGKNYIHYYIVQKISEEGFLELTDEDYENIMILKSGTTENIELIKKIRDNYKGQ